MRSSDKKGGLGVRILLETLFLVGASYAFFRWGTRFQGAKKIAVTYLIPFLLLEFTVLALFYLPPLQVAPVGSTKESRPFTFGLTGTCVEASSPSIIYQAEPKTVGGECRLGKAFTEKLEKEIEVQQSGWMAHVQYKFRPDTSLDPAVEPRYRNRPEALLVEFFSEQGEPLAHAEGASDSMIKDNQDQPFFVRQGDRLKARFYLDQPADIDFWCQDGEGDFLFRVSCNVACESDAECEDGDAKTMDQCHYAGKCFSYCTHASDNKQTMTPPNALRVESIPELRYCRELERRQQGSLFDALALR